MTYQQTYQEWLDHLDENDPLRKQLVDIKDDEVNILGIFHHLENIKDKL